MALLLLVNLFLYTLLFLLRVIFLDYHLIFYRLKCSMHGMWFTFWPTL